MMAYVSEKVLVLFTYLKNMIFILKIRPTII